MNFDQAFNTLLKHEGGFSDHPADPGGKTRYGITEAVAREVGDRKSTRLNSSHIQKSRMPSSA